MDFIIAARGYIIGKPEGPGWRQNHPREDDFYVDLKI